MPITIGPLVNLDSFTGFIALLEIEDYFAFDLILALIVYILEPLHGGRYDRELNVSEIENIYNCGALGIYFYNFSSETMQFCEDIRTANNMHTLASGVVGDAYKLCY